MKNNWWNRLLRPKAKARGPALARRRRCRLSLEALEVRCVPDAGFRSITGYGNNIANPTFGAAGADLIRIAPSAYADGISAPAGQTSSPCTKRGDPCRAAAAH